MNKSLKPDLNSDPSPQKDPAHNGDDNALEKAIGHQIKKFRKQLNMTITEVANQSGLSPGMMSKVENGLTSPSLATLNSLSNTLNVPVTAFFRSFEEARSATFVKGGEGLKIERRGTRAGHQYQLLGHTVDNQLIVEPYLISLDEKSDVFPMFQHPGVEFIYVLQGVVVYRHANETYQLQAGDSLYFDSDSPHGPEELIELPIRFLSVIIQPRESQ